MRIAGLFAGIGGIEVGLGEAGHAASFFCELSPAARAVLNARFPGVPCVADVREIKDLPGDIELLTGGFPCQDLSQAGMTAGISGAKSGLVGSVFRLIDRRRTPWVLLENVSFMLQLDSGRAMSFLADEFESRGYRWAYRVVNTLSFLPQRRERVLFLATTRDVDPADVLLADDEAPPVRTTALDVHAHGFYWTEGIRGLGWAADAVPTLKNGSTVGIASPPAILLPDGQVITPDIRDAERLQGFSEDWTLPAAAGGRKAVRWSLVGNAVSTPVAAWLGSRLAQPGRYEIGRDRPLDPKGRWPRAARGASGARKSVAIGDHPVWAERPALADFLRHPGKPLSARATRGFLLRTERGTLRFVDGFREKLHAHLSSMDAQGNPHPLPMAAE